MIYPFKCSSCGKEIEEVRPASESAKLPICGDCGSQMSRVWAAPHINMQQSGYYDHGLGCYVKNRSEAMQILKRNSDVDPVDIGNDRESLRKLRPAMADYSIPRGALDGMD